MVFLQKIALCVIKAVQLFHPNLKIEPKHVLHLALVTF